MSHHGLGADGLVTPVAGMLALSLCMVTVAARPKLE